MATDHNYEDRSQWKRTDFVLILDQDALRVLAQPPWEDVFTAFVNRSATSRIDRGFAVIDLGLLLWAAVHCPTCRRGLPPQRRNGGGWFHRGPCPAADAWEVSRDAGRQRMRRRLKAIAEYGRLVHGQREYGNCAVLTVHHSRST
jgi:hypothetical protein